MGDCSQTPPALLVPGAPPAPAPPVPDEVSALELSALEGAAELSALELAVVVPPPPGPLVVVGPLPPVWQMPAARPGKVTHWPAPSQSWSTQQNLAQTPSGAQVKPR